MSDDIRYDADGAVARITIDRPATLNALAGATADAIADALRRADADPAVRVILLRGAGRAFSTGLDLASVNLDRDVHLGDEVLKHHFEPLIAAIRETPKPVVCAVNGPAAGISAGIALLCDLTVATRSAYFFLPFINLAVIPDGGLTWLLTRTLGPQHALGLSLAGARIGADEAAAQRLIWRAVEDAQFDAEVEALVTRLVSLPAGTVARIKQAVRTAPQQPLDAQLLLERQLQEDCGRSADFREGVDAFLGKRKPVFNRSN